MTIASDLERIIGAKADIKVAVGEKGVTIPDTTLISDYHTYIDQIVTTPPIDPTNPTFEGLKLALSTDDPASYFPVGTEIPDTYDSKDNPMIVAQYLDASNNSAYGGSVGVILIRKYADPVSQTFGNPNYYNSAVQAFLNGDYYTKCSDELKSVMSDIQVPYYDTGAILRAFAAKLWLMSDVEVLGDLSSYKTGFAWDVWKIMTGLTTPSYGENSGRIGRRTDGVATPWWLRSWYSGDSICFVLNNGSLTSGRVSSTYCGIRPACFIAKD